MGGLLLLILLLICSPARAGEPDLITIEARGEAPAGAADPRIAALDAAFVDAVSRALARQADAAQLQRSRRGIDAEILARPRRFIASFKTLGSGTVQGRMSVRIQARVDAGKLRAALNDLGIATGDRARPRGRPRVLVLVGGPAAAPLIRELTEQGFPAVAPRDGDAARPGDDQAALRAARAAGAGAVVTGSATVEADRPIRGTNLVSAVAQARLRLVDVDSGDAVASAEISEAGHGDDPPAAAQAAARALALRAARALAQPAARRWPEARTATGGVVVVVRGATRWPSIEAIRTTLGGIPGVTRAWVRRAGRGEVELGIDGLSAADRIAGALRTGALPRGSLRVVEVAGERVDIAVDGDGGGDD